MSPLEVAEILQDLSYKDWEFVSVVEESDWNLDQRVFIQLVWTDPNEDELQKSRKWYISPHSTKSEVVQTALLAVLVAEEHETREQFRYKGAKIFGPHFDVDVMVEISKKKANLDLRTPAVV